MIGSVAQAKFTRWFQQAHRPKPIRFDQSLFLMHNPFETKLKTALFPAFLLLAFGIAGIARGENVKLPAVPQGFHAMSRQLGVSLQWQPVMGASSYKIERARAPQGPYETLEN